MRFNSSKTKLFRLTAKELFHACHKSLNQDTDIPREVILMITLLYEMLALPIGISPIFYCLMKCSMV